MKLVIHNLTKKYKKKTALHNVSIEMDHGIYALLGPNGAGKTTLIHAITGLLAYDDGDIQCYDDEGKPLDHFYEVLGYLPQYPSFYKNFTVYEMLKYISVLKGLKKDVIEERIQEVLEEVNLSKDQHLKVKALSGGMKQRLGIAQAILNHPRILIVDEPTAGLDPRERIRFRNIIKNISRNTIVLFATHIVSDIELIATDIIILKNGELILHEKRKNVLEKIRNKIWILEDAQMEIDDYLKTYQVLEAFWLEDKIHIRIISDTCPHPNAVQAEPRLEDLYMYYFGDAS